MKEHNTPWQVGDELAFDVGRTEPIWVIRKITHVTPTGRITCGSCTLNPDLRIRGTQSWNGPSHAVPVTPEIRKKVLRQHHIKFLEQYNFAKLPDNVLSQLVITLKHTITKK